MPISLDSGSEGNPGIGSAVLLGAIWPISLFNQRFRQPELCTHPAHAEHWAKVEKVRMPAGLRPAQGRVSQRLVIAIAGWGGYGAYIATQKGYPSWKGALTGLAGPRGIAQIKTLPDNRPAP